jgi:hypothetical protein
MPDVAVLAVPAAAVAAFVLSGAWYAAFGAQLAAARAAGTADEAMPPWKVGVELARSLVLSAVVAGLASRADVDGLAGGLLLGLVLWLAFPLVLWTGAIVHEGTRWQLAAIHGGDWLAKLLVIGAIVSVWQ